MHWVQINPTQGQKRLVKSKINEVDGPLFFYIEETLDDVFDSLKNQLLCLSKEIVINCETSFSKDPVFPTLNQKWQWIAVPE